MDVNEILFRCHRLGDIMTESKSTITDKQLELVNTLQSKMKRTEKQDEELARLLHKRDNPELSATAKTYCEQLYLEAKTGRRKMMTNKYIEKGLREEEAGLTLISLVKNVFLKKNNQRLSNKFITGEVDTYIGESVKKAKWVYDVKIAWDIFTMPYFNKSVNPDYEYQGQGYNALTGADGTSIIHCLVNAPANMIVREKERIYYMLGCPDETDAKYMESRIEIEKSMIFDLKQFIKDNPTYDLDCKDWKFDIPQEDRLVEFVIGREEKMILSIYERAQECRDWIETNLMK